MDAHTRKLLELDELKKIVTAHALCDLGRRRIDESPLLTSRKEIVREYDKVAEMLLVFSSEGHFPTEGITDVEELVDRVAVANSFLNPEEYLQLFNFFSAVTNIKSLFEELKQAYPLLYELTRVLVPMPSFKRMVRDTFTPDAEVKDDATDELKEIRSRKKELSKRIDSALEKYLYDPSRNVMLQENFITERNYRKVLPVKVEYKRHVRGIVHAYSITEETAFIEPMEVVEMSNELTDIIVEEQKEIRRILTEIGDLLREKMEPLRLDIDVLSEIDSLYARADYARNHKCSIPEVNDTGEVLIEEGRHPLLTEALGKKCIPLNMTLAAKDRALIISGPNAGGKTTAVKTVGIFGLMVQSAIPLPAKPTSSFPVFTDFFADIGDEQSLSEGISTFSSHIKQIKVIVENAPENSLVILDELGTGTDPAEGALLAQAILEELAARSATVLVTSHLTSLKTLDQTKEWARTASFSLDPDTEAPNFLMVMDVAGESNALKIARLLGLPKSLVDRAYELMSPEERQLKSVVESVKNERSRLEKLRKEAQKEKKEIARSRERYYRLIDELEIEKSNLREFKLKERKEAALEKKKMIAEAKKKIERLIANLPSKEEIIRARETVVREQEELTEEIAGIDRKLRRDSPKRGKPARASDLKPGTTVYIETLHGFGTVQRVNESRGKVDVTVDNLAFNVDIAEVYVPEHEIEAPPAPEVRTRQVTPAKRVATNELNLIGKRVDVSLEELDKFIDDALMSGFDTIRIIHGIGTGALRTAVRQHLKSHPRIKSFRSGDVYEGHHAVTIAEVG